MCTGFCPGNDVTKPVQNYASCYVGTYNEEVAKYWGVCYNYGHQFGSTPQNQKLDQEYANEAYRYLAYYALANSPSYCAGEGTNPTVDKNKEVIGRARSSAGW